MAVAPEADAPRRVGGRGRGAARVRRARRPAGPDHAVAPRLGRRAGRHRRSGSPTLWTPGRSDLCFATTNRQSALMAMAPRCDAVVVIGSANSSNTRALEKLALEAGCRAGVPDQPGRRAARRPRRHDRRDRRGVGARGARRRRHRPARAAPRRRAGAASPTRTSTSRRRATSATCRPRWSWPSRRCSAARAGPRPMDDRALAASDVLAAL